MKKSVVVALSDSSTRGNGSPRKALNNIDVCGPSCGFLMASLVVILFLLLALVCERCGREQCMLFDVVFCSEFT